MAQRRIWRLWGTGCLVGGQGVWGTEVLQRGPGVEPLVVGSGGIASRKLIAVIKDIWLPNHAQFCVFSSTAQPWIFLWTQFFWGGPCPPLAAPLCSRRFRGFATMRYINLLLTLTLTLILSVCMLGLSAANLRRSTKCEVFWWPWQARQSPYITLKLPSHR